MVLLEEYIAELMLGKELCSNVLYTLHPLQLFRNRTLNDILAEVFVQDKLGVKKITRQQLSHSE